MTEDEWVKFDDPRRMWAESTNSLQLMYFFFDRGILLLFDQLRTREERELCCRRYQSHFRRRKVQLFACACFRQFWDVLVDERLRIAVILTEQFADGLIHDPWRFVSTLADDVRWSISSRRKREDAARNHTTRTLAFAVQQMNYHCYLATAKECADVLAWTGLLPTWNDAVARQANLLRDMGYPFQQLEPLSDSILSWNDYFVPRLAKSIYAVQGFDRLPILHDALLDAGCTDETLLSHCRSPEGHVLGCWALDLILGKE